MSNSTHSARVVAPIPYTSAVGRKGSIPPGPCLIEELDNDHVDIVWGRRGERSAVLPTPVVAAAEECGRLVLLD